MGDISHICLSDMHFGADNSVLTRLAADGSGTDPAHPSDVLVHLVACLRQIANANSGPARPRLILNGDILDLAFASEGGSALAFQQFIELAMPQDPAARLFDPAILHIPGNHDHHLWESCRERRFVDALAASDFTQAIPPSAHITAMRDPVPVPGDVMQALMRRLPWLSDVTAGTVYPNLSFAKAQRMVIFTHGHFIEDAYLMVSALSQVLFPGTPPPATMEAWEAENFAWIDFVWSLLGRSGQIGHEVEDVYQVAQSPALIGGLLGAAARGLVLARGGAVGKSLADGVGEIVTSFVTKAFERNNPETLLGDDAAGLKRFLAGPLAGQITAEYPGLVPSEVAVVFGHTHKPFQAAMPLDGFLAPQVAAWNSGGWVVDSPAPQPLFGGAVILMDDDLNLASLRMYNEGTGKGVSLQGIDGQPNPLTDRLAPLVNAGAWPWKDFSAAASVAVQQHTARVAAFLKRAAGAPPTA